MGGQPTGRDRPFGAARHLEVVPDRHRIEILVDEDLEVVVDRSRLEQIVANLAGNAVKHGQPPVVIAAVREGRTLTLSVQDGGHGVPTEHRSGLFTAFAQGPRSDSVGLGLWIVAQLAQAHGGRAFLDETAPGGTTFVVHLDGLDADADEARPPPPAHPRPSVTT